MGKQITGVQLPRRVQVGFIQHHGLTLYLTMTHRDTEVMAELLALSAPLFHLFDNIRQEITTT
jgi:hypothetical protein